MDYEIEQKVFQAKFSHLKTNLLNLSGIARYPVEAIRLQVFFGVLNVFNATEDKKWCVGFVL